MKEFGVRVGEGRATIDGVMAACAFMLAGLESRVAVLGQLGCCYRAASLLEC
jgi:hypothetical protein